MGDTAADLNVQIKQGIVRSLRLPITWEEIGDDTPLFDGGLGLDSIDVLELVLEIERQFGVSIADEQTGATVLQSVNTIAEFVRAHRSGAPA
ncbi:MAG: acyl carrier protein [Vicinamibacterales bacterium]